MRQYDVVSDLVAKTAQFIEVRKKKFQDGRIPTKIAANTKVTVVGCPDCMQGLGSIFVYDTSDWDSEQTILPKA